MSETRDRSDEVVELLQVVREISHEGDAVFDQFVAIAEGEALEDQNWNALSIIRERSIERLLTWLAKVDLELLETELVELGDEIEKGDES